MKYKWSNIRYIGPDRLYLHAGFGDSQMVSLLLRHGDAPNVISRNGETPLLACTRISSEPVLLLLLSRGADPNLQCLRHETPLHVVSERG